MVADLPLVNTTSCSASSMLPPVEQSKQAIALNNRGVTNGYFTVPLDFGIAAYSGGGSRFIQMEYARRAPRWVRGNLAADRDDTGAVYLVCPQWQCRTQGRQGRHRRHGTAGPQGLQGIAGAKGDAGLNFRGAWSSVSNYVSSDAVFHEGATWVAKRPNIAVAPTAGQDWAVLAAKGDAGPQGLQGLQGVKVTREQWDHRGCRTSGTSGHRRSQG